MVFYILEFQILVFIAVFAVLIMIKRIFLHLNLLIVHEIVIMTSEYLTLKTVLVQTKMILKMLICK